MNIRVTAGPHAYINCPMKVRIDVPDLGYGEATLVDADENRIPCQIFNDCGVDCIGWIEPSLSPQEVRTYRLETSPLEIDSGVEIEEIGEGRLEVRIGGELFTRYHFGDQWVRPFLYPFTGPDSTPVTRAFPIADDVEGEDRDHPHHKSVWVAHGKINDTDNWSESTGHAYIRHRKFEEVTGGAVFGRIRAVNNWVNADGAKQMEELREYTFFNLQSERLADVRIKFEATDGDVCIGDTKEGGVLSIRVVSTMNGNKGGKITNVYGGVTESETWGKPAHWVDYSGPVGDKTMGIAVMDHPSSFRHPTRWHVRDYGLFTANPFALSDYEPELGLKGDHTICNGDSISFAYRIYVHAGDVEQASVRDRYIGFAAPPKAEVV